MQARRWLEWAERLRTHECRTRTHECSTPRHETGTLHHRRTARAHERPALFSIIRPVREHECRTPAHDASALFSITMSVVESVNISKSHRIKRIQNCPVKKNRFVRTLRLALGSQLLLATGDCPLAPGSPATDYRLRQKTQSNSQSPDENSRYETSRSAHAAHRPAAQTPSSPTESSETSRSPPQSESIRPTG